MGILKLGNTWNVRQTFTALGTLPEGEIRF